MNTKTSGHSDGPGESRRVDTELPEEAATFESPYWSQLILVLAVATRDWSDR